MLILVLLSFRNCALLCHLVICSADNGAYNPKMSGPEGSLPIPSSRRFSIIFLPFGGPSEHMLNISGLYVYSATCKVAMENRCTVCTVAGANKVPNNESRLLQPLIFSLIRYPSDFCSPGPNTSLWAIHRPWTCALWRLHPWAGWV